MYSVIGADGQLYGPVPIDTLKVWCQQGRIIATTTLMQAGTNASLRASDLQELHPYFVGPGSRQPGVQTQTIHPAGQNPQIQQGSFGQFQQPGGQIQINQQATGQPHVSTQPYQPGGFQQPGQPYGQQPYGPHPGHQHPGYQQGPTPFSAPFYRGQPGSAGVRSNRSKAVAAIIALLFGSFGIHRFYLGYSREGMAMLVLSIAGIVLFLFACPLLYLGVSIWALVDFVKILSDAMPDADGYPLS